MKSAIATHHKPNHSSAHHSPSSSSSSGSSPSACAACKYQRRRCTRDCVLAPYFPADNQKQFLNAHRLFGVSNILKILKSVDVDSHKEAMRSIIFQSNARAQDPVGGCYRIILDLKQHIDILSAELSYVRSKIMFYRAQVGSATNMANSDEASYIPATTISDVYANIGVMQQQQQEQQYQQYYNYYLYDAQGGQGSEHNGNIGNGTGFDMNINALGGDGLEMEMFGLHQRADGDEDVKPLVDIFDTQHAFKDDGDSKDATACSTITALQFSSKADPKDEQNDLEHVQEHDLKGAASLFTLTNCNASLA